MNATSFVAACYLTMACLAPGVVWAADSQNPVSQEQSSGEMSAIDPNNVSTNIESTSYDPLTPVPAKDEDEIEARGGSRHVSLFGTTILPTIGITIGYDDNLTLVDGNKVDSSFVVVSPGIRIEIPTDRSLLAFIYELEIGRYEDSSIDDYEDQKLRAEYTYEPTSRSEINLFAEYREGHDARGTGARQGDLAREELEPDEYEIKSLGGNWRYGAAGARGKLELNAGTDDFEYTNNRDLTEVRDRDRFFWGGTFFWRLAPKTSALFEYQWAEVDYDSIDLDSEETKYLVGLQWDATAKTSGTIKFGQLEKDFDSPGRLDYDGTTWSANINWRPRTYSIFNLKATKQTEETDGFGDFVLREDLSLSWNHDWSDRFGTVADIGIGEDDHRPDFRVDDLFYWGLGAKFRLNHYFILGAGAKYYERDSSEAEFDYERFLYLLTLEGSY